MNDKYDPARRPSGEIPGGEHVTFEREGQYEQGIFGGSAADIEASILNSTERNIQIIGWKIVGVQDIVGDMGAGTLQELELQVQKQGVTVESKIMRITGIGLRVEIL